MNRIKFLIAACAIFAASLSVTRAQDVVFKHNFGGSGTDSYVSVTAVSDGIVAVGTSTSHSFNSGDWEGVTGHGNYDAIIVKYDNAGSVVWKKHFGGKGNDRYFSVTTVSDGIVAVGYSDPTSFNNGDWAGVTGKGGVDAIIVKYDNAGNIVWRKNFGGMGYDYFSSVTAVSDGFIAVGDTDLSSYDSGDWAGVIGNGVDDAVIVKFDNASNIV